MSTLKTTNLQNASASSPAFVLAADGSATAQLSSVNGGPISGARNRIINGDMRIDQRNAGASVSNSVPPATFTMDRWSIYGTSASKFTCQQNAGSVTPPAGFTNYLGITSSAATSPASTDLYLLSHKIEGFNVADLSWGTASAQSVTFSFWVRSSLTGTHSASLGNSAANRNYVFSYSISTANTWEYKTVTIPGDTSGTWLTNNGIGIQIYWNLGSGSSQLGSAGSWGSTFYYGATGSVSVVATNGATFYITGVQLEAGSVATPFERRSYGQELSLCQRYYYRIGPVGSSKTFANANADTATTGWAVGSFPVIMRTSPTALEQSGTASDYAVRTGGVSRTCSAVPTFDNATTDGWMILYQVASGQTAGQAGFLRSASVTTAYLGWSAEL